jgi:L-seryl-tRNA(Ser) seleniumtransferase
VKPLINAWGPMTVIGSARVRPEVVAAMAEAATSYVDLIELQRAAGARLAALIGVEACYLAGGCAAGLAIATAACITGADPARIARLPDTSGLKSEVVMQRTHRNPYDHAIRQVGVRLVEIGNPLRTFAWELDAAIGPPTAAVVYVYGRRTMHEPLSLPETVDIAHARQVPVIVDAAAEVPPARNLRGLSQTGADVVVISGGKGLRGPQNSALVLTRREVVEACLLNACPNHSLGRSMKITKEDMVGLVRAVELFLSLDHAAIERGWREDVARVEAALQGIAGVRVIQDEARYSEGIPVARIEVDAEQLGQSAAQIAAALAAGDPGIRVTQLRDWLSINPQFLEPGEIDLVTARLRQVLAG